MIFAIGRGDVDIAAGTPKAALLLELHSETTGLGLSRWHEVGPVVPREAVAGAPAEYGAAVIDNTLSLLATVTTTEELLRVWKEHDVRPE